MTAIKIQGKKLIDLLTRTACGSRYDCDLIFVCDSFIDEEEPYKGLFYVHTIAWRPKSGQVVPDEIIYNSFNSSQVVIFLNNLITKANFKQSEANRNLDPIHLYLKIINPKFRYGFNQFTNPNIDFGLIGFEPKQQLKMTKYRLLKKDTP